MSSQNISALRERCVARLHEIIEGIPVLEPDPEALEGGSTALLVPRSGSLSIDRLRLKAGGRSLMLVAVFTADGSPRSVRAAVQLGQSVADGRSPVDAAAGSAVGRRVVMVLTPRLGPTGRAICRDAGAGWCDLAGNLHLLAGPVYIDRERPEPTRPERRVLRHLFAPRAGRVLRVLLNDVSRSWTLTDLAREAGVSLGLTHRIKERLLDEEVARMVGRRLQVHRPEPLLTRWPAAVALAEDKIHDFYAPGTAATNERGLADFCRDRRIPYAFTRESAFQRRVGPIRYLLSQAWVLAPIDELAKALGWEPATRRANFRLLEPPDYGTLYGIQEVAGDRLVSDPQLYLDLADQGERGKAAAELLLERALRPTWALALSDFPGEPPKQSHLPFRQPGPAEDAPD